MTDDNIPPVVHKSRIRKVIFRLSARFRSDSFGVSAVEFALVCTVLLPIFAGVADFSRYLWNVNEVDQAVRAGAQYATGNPTEYANIATTVRASTSLGTDPVKFTTSTDRCSCGQPLATLLTAFNYNTMTVALGPCATVLAACTTGGYRGYLRIMGTFTFAPILGTISLAPSVASNTVLMRVQ